MAYCSEFFQTSEEKGVSVSGHEVGNKNDIVLLFIENDNLYQVSQKFLIVNSKLDFSVYCGLSRDIDLQIV